MLKRIVLPKILFFTTGLPGAGKTSFATKLTKFTNVKRLSIDSVSYELFLFPKFNDPTERKIILEEMDRRAEDLLWSDIPIIYDGNFNTIEKRKHPVEFAKKQGIPFTCIYINTPKSVSEEAAKIPRQEEKPGTMRVVTQEQFEQKVKEFEDPNEISHVEINGTDEFSKQYEIVSNFLKEQNIS